MISFTYDSPIGSILIQWTDEGINRVDFTSEYPTGNILPDSRLTQLAVTQLTEYFSGQRREFTLPLHIVGTPFRKQVWQILQTIPYGDTRNYQQIAAAIGNPKALRAVGQANHFNPIALIIPCHRVIGKNGSMTGYGGAIWRKEWLLEHEKKYTTKINS